jgi:hypothetical protein
MLARYDSYTEFTNAVYQGAFLEDYQRLLSQRYWGWFFSRLDDAMKDIVIGEVFNNTGRFTSGKTGDEIFSELKQLLPTSRCLFMDRWQYYWCLRNLNYVDGWLRKVLSIGTFYGVIILASTIAALATILDGRSYSGWSVVLSAVAAGALIWLLVVCAGSSLLIVRIFGSTGTFTLSYPCRDVDFDPMWSQVIQVGIFSFAASFIIYGIGSPFLLEPAALTHFDLAPRFIVYASGSFLFCALVFVLHAVGIHKLMLVSKTNALDRVSNRLVPRSASDQDRLDIEHFKEVRGLRVWPIKSTTIAQLTAGILLPVIVQIILIYTGIKSR